MTKHNRFAPEVRQRAIRMVLENQRAASVHHAIRTVKLQLTDCGETRGRWVIEGDLSSYFDTAFIAY